jgi:hypothetical protein
MTFLVAGNCGRYLYDQIKTAAPANGAERRQSFGQQEKGLAYLF